MMIGLYHDYKEIINALAAVIAGAAVIIFLILTVERWLLYILNAMDKVLTRIGFGTYSARILTSVEDWFREKKKRREL